MEEHELAAINDRIDKVERTIHERLDKIEATIAEVILTRAPLRKQDLDDLLVCFRMVTNGLKAFAWFLKWAAWLCKWTWWILKRIAIVIAPIVSVLIGLYMTWKGLKPPS